MHFLNYPYTIDLRHGTLAQYTVVYTDSTAYGGAQGRSSSSAKPKLVELFPGYPNPAKQSMTIRYALPKPGWVKLGIYDITGRQVTTLAENHRAKPGYHSLTWNCSDDRNRRLAAGVYFCRLVVSEGAWSNAEALLSKQALHSTIRTRKLVVSR